MGSISINDGDGDDGDVDINGSMHDYIFVVKYSKSFVKL